MMEEKVLGNKPKGKLFVVSAPAGTGKTTLVKKLTEQFSCIKMSISFTTRTPRPNEVDGIDYHFISHEEFQKKIETKDLLEYVELHGEYYGTSKAQVEKLQNDGKHVVLVIDTQGGLNLKNQIEVVLIFIMPPTFEELSLRLNKRKTEKLEEIEKRLSWAKHEMEDAKHYDYIIVNDNLNTAYQVLKSIFIAEEHRIK